MKAKHGSQLKFDFLVRNHVTLGNNIAALGCVFFLLWSSQDTADSAVVLEN